MKTGQYMTPKPIADLMLDTISYQGNRILSQKILEPSFGSGVFLVKIAERLYETAKALGRSNEIIARILHNNIYGFEIDEHLYQRAISRLDNFCSSRNIPVYNWNNLLHTDAFDAYERYIGEMDYIIGNPPFIRIHDMDEKAKEQAKKFDFSKGSTDTYIMFYEIGLKMLNEEGRLCYITPNALLKVVSAQKFRDYIINNKLLSYIYDFKDNKLFEGAETYNCIMCLDKNTDSNNQIAVRLYKGNKYDSFDISCYYFDSVFLGKAWSLCSQEDLEFLKASERFPQKLKDICTIQNACVTQKNDVFICNIFIDENCTLPYTEVYSDADKTVYIQREGKVYPIENKAIRRAVKASKFDGVLRNTYVVFPYQENDTCGYIPMKEDSFKNTYPMAYNYLYLFKEDLLKRDKDDNAEWFHFGRGQGLSNSNREKAVFSHIINTQNDALSVYILDKDVVVYSGLYTIADKAVSMSSVRDVLSSKELMRYLKLTGKQMSGGYVSVSAKILQNFGCKTIQ